MKVPCADIARSIKKDLKSRTARLKKKRLTPKLVTILIGEAPEQLSFVKIKQKVAKELGIKFEFIHIKKTPTFFEFIGLLKQKAADPETTGVIVQQPLPSHLQTNTIYNFIPPIKEIEQHREKSPHFPPLGLAALTILKFVYQKGKISKNLVVEEDDIPFFKQTFKHKKVVLAGRGPTGGAAIGKTLSDFKINYLSVNSQTHNPEQYYKEADVIITAVGRKVVNKEDLKPGAVLVNVGLRREGGKLRGDYDEKDVRKVAHYYTETPGGVGPIDVLYLYKNLLDAAEMQAKDDE